MSSGPAPRPASAPRDALAVLAGVIAGGVVVGAVESVGHLIWPPPPGLDVSDPATLVMIPNPAWMVVGAVLGVPATAFAAVRAFAPR